MNLDTLEQLADAATPGPWEFSRESENVSTYDGELDIAFRYTPSYEEDMTGEFIAAANPATIKALIALCKQLNVLIYDAIESGDDDPLREALAAYEQFNSGETK